MLLVPAGVPGAPGSSDDGKSPRTPITMPREGSTYMLEVASFDGTGQCIEAEAPQQDLGGESGLTIAAWVRRARTTSTDPRAVDCDRLIDFGNGQQQENIVINFKEGVRYERLPLPAPCHSPPTVRVAPLVRSYEIWQHSAEMCECEYINGKHQRKRGRSLQDGASLFPENAWVHVAVVHGGDGTATLFLNGSICARGPVALPSHVPRGEHLDYPGPSPHQPPLRSPPHHHHLRTLPPAASLAC